MKEGLKYINLEFKKKFSHEVTVLALNRGYHVKYQQSRQKK